MFEQEILDRLVDLWREALDDNTIGPEADVLQLGATSLQMMTVMGQMGGELRIEPPAEALFDAVTIRDQATAIEYAVSYLFGDYR